MIVDDDNPYLESAQFNSPVIISPLDVDFFLSACRITCVMLVIRLMTALFIVREKVFNAIQTFLQSK